MNFGIHIALSDDTPCPLLQVAGTPGSVQIMQSDKPVLHIRACAHFCRAAHEDAHLPGTHFGE